MRCLALGQAWKDAGGKTILITACKNDNFLERLREEDFFIHSIPEPYPEKSDWNHTRNIINNYPNAWIVLDGYHFDSTFQKWIKETNHQLLVIDDMAHLNHYHSDIILNQNLHANKLDYNCESNSKLLLGTKYVLLRREFLKWRGWKRRNPEAASKILVTLGGSDPDNVTLKVIKALQQAKASGLEALIIAGGNNPHYDKLQSAIRNLKCSFRLERNVTNIPELMAWSDVAISAGGITVWESAFMGLPSIILILFANQHPIAEELDKAGMAVNLRWHKDISTEDIAQVLLKLLPESGRREEMSRCGQELVDGEGISRVLMFLKGEMLRLRPVREDDCKLLWEWVNDPGVRASAFTSDPIPWEEHVKWFKYKLQDPNCYIFIVFDEQDTSIGQARFDSLENGQAKIDVSIDKQKRELGYGSLIINMAVKELLSLTSIRSVHAFIKPQNKNSISAFKKAQFNKYGIETVKGNIAWHYVRVKNDN